MTLERHFLLLWGLEAGKKVVKTHCFFIAPSPASVFRCSFILGESSPSSLLFLISHFLSNHFFFKDSPSPSPSFPACLSFLLFPKLSCCLSSIRPNVLVLDSCSLLFSFSITSLPYLFHYLSYTLNPSSPNFVLKCKLKFPLCFSFLNLRAEKSSRNLSNPYP